MEKGAKVASRTIRLRSEAVELTQGWGRADTGHRAAALRDGSLHRVAAGRTKQRGSRCPRNASHPPSPAQSLSLLAQALVPVDSVPETG